jgi:hypothetical protein
MATLTEARNLVVAGVLEIPDGQPIAVEVLLIALASAVLGLGTSAVIVGLAGGIPGNCRPSAAGSASPPAESSRSASRRPPYRYSAAQPLHQRVRFE